MDWDEDDTGEENDLIPYSQLTASMQDYVDGVPAYITHGYPSQSWNQHIFQKTPTGRYEPSSESSEGSYRAARRRRYTSSSSSATPELTSQDIRDQLEIGRRNVAQRTRYSGESPSSSASRSSSQQNVNNLLAIGGGSPSVRSQNSPAIPYGPEILGNLLLGASQGEEVLNLEAGGPSSASLEAARNQKKVRAITISSDSSGSSTYPTQANSYRAEEPASQFNISSILALVPEDTEVPEDVDALVAMIPQRMGSRATPISNLLSPSSSQSSSGASQQAAVEDLPSQTFNILQDMLVGSGGGRESDEEEEEEEEADPRFTPALARQAQQIYDTYGDIKLLAGRSRQNQVIVAECMIIYRTAKSVATLFRDKIHWVPSPQWIYDVWVSGRFERSDMEFESIRDVNRPLSIGIDWWLDSMANFVTGLFTFNLYKTILLHDEKIARQRNKEKQNPSIGIFRESINNDAAYWEARSRPQPHLQSATAKVMRLSRVESEEQPVRKRLRTENPVDEPPAKRAKSLTPVSSQRQVFATTVPVQAVEAVAPPAEMVEVFEAPPPPENELERDRRLGRDAHEEHTEFLRDRDTAPTNKPVSQQPAASRARNVTLRNYVPPRNTTIGQFFPVRRGYNPVASIVADGEEPRIDGQMHDISYYVRPVVPPRGPRYGPITFLQADQEETFRDEDVG